MYSHVFINLLLDDNLMLKNGSRICIPSTAVLHNKYTTVCKNPIRWEYWFGNYNYIFTVETTRLADPKNVMASIVNVTTHIRLTYNGCTIKLQHQLFGISKPRSNFTASNMHLHVKKPIFVPFKAWVPLESNLDHQTPRPWKIRYCVRLLAYFIISQPSQLGMKR